MKKLALTSLSLLIALILPTVLTLSVYAASGDYELRGRSIVLDTDDDTKILSVAADGLTFSAGDNIIPSYIRNTGKQTTRFEQLQILDSNETRSSSTLQNSLLQFSIPTTGERYFQLEYGLHWDNGAGTENGIFRINTDAKLEFDGMVCFTSTSSTPSSTCLESVTNNTNITTNNLFADYFYIRGYFYSPGGLSSSTIALQWAQAVTNGANPHTLYAGSYVKSTQIQ